MTTVYTQKKERLSIDDKDLVGSGGEGSVFKDPQNPRGLIKIYEHPNKQQGQKLIDFQNASFSIPNNTAYPTEVVYDNRGNVIGFRMAFFKGATPFRKLSDRKHCNKNGLGAKTITTLHIELAKTINKVHPQGIILGDGNDLNTLFKNDSVYIIDVDSWQFGSWACPVATENFLNPRLYGQDLSKKPLFKLEDDWYSFAVMLHKSLLKVHPYGGTYPTLNTLPERAVKHITVHDKGVIYPAVGLTSEVVSDDLNQVFYKYFKQGKSTVFPINILENFSTSLTTCPSCKQEFPKNRRTCPTCQAQNKATLNLTIPGSVTYKDLLRIKGNIIFEKLEDKNTLIIVATENNFATLYLINQLGIQKIPLFNHLKETEFEASSKIIATSQPGSETLDIYKISQGQANFIGNLNTDVYSGINKAIYKVSEDHIFHIIGAQLVKTTVLNNQFLSEPIRQIITNQTWFTTSNDSNFICLGFHRVLRQQFFWLSRPNYSSDINLPFLERGEGLLDIKVNFDNNQILVMRKTKQAGKEYIRFDLLDTNGNILHSAKHEAAVLPTDNLHGLDFSKGQLVYPTDQGVVRLDVKSLSKADFTSTNKLVDTKHSLYLYQKGLLVTNDNSVHQLITN